MGRAKVIVLKEDDNGLNELLSINGITCDNETAYRMAKNGLVEGYHGVTNSNKTKFIRSNPDKSKKNNLG